MVGDLADVAAEIQDLRNVALAIHNAPSAERVADALVDAVLKRYIHIEGKCIKAANARGVEDVVGSLQRASTLGAGAELGRQPVGGNVALGQLGDHFEVALVDVVKGKLAVG